MIKHTSNKFQFDKQATQIAYDGLTNKFLNDKIQSFCLPKIADAAIRQLIDIGIDYKKPWAEYDLGNYYQIEYLFVGSLESKNDTYVFDDLIGINVFEEKMFGKIEFNSEDILNLTLIIDK